MGIEHQMSITLPAPRPIVVGLALNRAEGDFDERDRAVLNLIRPHLAQTWRRAREHERLDQLVGAAAGALCADGSGVVVLTEPIHELTPGALVALYRFFGRPTPRDPLPARVRHWLEAHHDRASAHANDLELSRPLRAVLHDRQLVLRHLPSARNHPDALLLDERRVDHVSTPLRAVGLTEREAAVLDLVGTGATNAEIAQQLQLSPWTVKRHLANVYAKLGVHGRLRASALALEITAHHARD
jgi:DNA-binding CsgD family transcriptional regulator